MSDTALISAAKARKKLDISESTEHRWRSERILPPHLKIRGRCFYVLSELEEMIESKRVGCGHV